MFIKFWRAYPVVSAFVRFPERAMLVCALLCFSISSAKAAEKSFQLPAQPLRSALIALAAQADVSIGLSGVSLAGKTSRSLTGYVDFEDALTRLLAGSGLGFREIDPATYLIYEVAALQTPQPVKAPRPLESTPIEEITITAAKRSESLQVTAASVAVVIKQVIADYGIHTAREAASFVSGLAATNQAPGDNKFFIRGVTDGAFTGSKQSAVGVYIDETRAIFDAPDPELQLVDIDRIEVIRGPQGTLYGAGSIGGLIRIITHAPELGKLETSVSGEGAVTDDGSPSHFFSGVLNVPLGDSAAVRAVAYTRRDGGYIENVRLSPNTNDVYVYGGRLGGRLSLSSDWTIKTSVIWQRLHARDSQYFDRTMRPFTRGNFLREPNSNEFFDLNAVIEGELGWADLTSSTAWIAQNVNTTFDASVALPALIQRPVAATAFERKNRYQTFNHETRLASTHGGPWRWLAGAFVSYREETSDTFLSLRTPSSGPFYTKHRIDNGTEVAIFGEATYALTQKLSVTAGLRGYYGMLTATANNTELLDVGPPEANGRNDKTGFTPKATLAYRVTPENLIYAEVAQGFRLGGINIDSRMVNPPSTGPGGRPPLTVRNFDSDRLWNFEIGAKTSFLHNTVQINADGFYAIWHDMQADLTRMNGLLFAANIGRVHNSGFELESTIAATPELVISANVSWSNPELRESSALAGAISANRLPVVPKFSSSISAQYQRQISANLLAYANLRLSFIGSARLINSTTMDSSASDYRIVNARAGVQWQGTKATLYVNNIFNTASNTYAFGNPFNLGRVPQVTPLRPRTVGVTLSWTR
jgi:iron complex outermembrane receptor protein